jgi:hypothetical protein
MMQLYSEKSSKKQMQPQKETINFLLNFSKSFEILKTKKENTIELNLN